jgi:phenylacetate-CoA ligase
MTGPSPFDASPLLGRAAALTRAELEALQLKKLRRQLERLYANSPYYRARMDQARLRPDHITSLALFREKFPLSTKTDFLADQAEAPPFGHRLSVPRQQVALVNMTGGTSGQGQEIYGRTHRDVHMQGYLHALPWFLAGLRAGHTAINCVPAGGMTTGGWGPGEGLRIIGATGFHVGGSMSTEAKIDLMLKIGDVNFIYASTNYLHTLTDLILRRGIDPREAFPNMRSLFIAAEGYPVEWAQKIEALWGCALREGYGSTQCAGFGASTCDRSVVSADGKRGLMHLFEWETLFEVVNPETREPVQTGEVGELIVTNLAVEGSPVVRFRSGDAARFFAHDECGLGKPWHAIESGTIGRFDDMMKIRGNNVWPSAIDAAIFAHAEIAEYAGRVFTTSDGKTEIEISLALSEPAALQFSPEQRHSLFESVRNAIKDRANIWVLLAEVPRDALPEFSYKARRWKDERQAGYRL